MKKPLTLLVFSFSLLTLHGQTWMWGKEGGNTSDTYGISADKNGNVFLPGGFFDSITFGSKHLVSADVDAFLVKYDSSGNVIWAEQSLSIGFNTTCRSFYSATDTTGNVFATGEFTDSTSLGAAKLVSKTIKEDVFLVKYNPNGNVLWARGAVAASNSSSGIGVCVATDKMGNAYETGIFFDTLSFGAFKVVNNVSTKYSVFTVKYDPNGNVLWANSAVLSGSAGNCFVNALTTDDAGNVYVTGYFQDTISFGGHKLFSQSNQAAFLVKYSSSGVVLWANQSEFVSSLSYAIGEGVVADHNGDVYLTGDIGDEVIFGFDTLMNNRTLGADIFFTKYDSSGNVIWAKQSTHTIKVDGWAGYSLAADKHNHVFMSIGLYLYYTKSASAVFEGKTFSVANAKDPSWLVMMDTAGNILSSIMSTTGGDDENTVACDPAGRYVYLGGDLFDTATFGPDHLRGDTIKEQPFVARWNPFYTMSNEGINELPNNNSNVIVYPNPSNGKFAIEVKSEKLKVNSFVEVYNMLGEKVLVSPTGEGKGIIDLTNSPTGIYLYRVISETGQLIGSGKLIKY